MFPSQGGRRKLQRKYTLAPVFFIGGGGIDATDYEGHFQTDDKSCVDHELSLRARQDQEQDFRGVHTAYDVVQRQMCRDVRRRTVVRRRTSTYKLCMQINAYK